MSNDDLKRRLQEHFTDGLVTIVGSGLSCAEGIPGMKELARQLLTDVPNSLSPELKSEWNAIAKKLKAGRDLESVMNENQPSPKLEEIIVDVTGQYIGQYESIVLEEVFSGSRTLRLTRLFPQLLKTKSGIPIITTNYERLVEVAAEAAGLGVDTMFNGATYAKLSPKECQFSFCRDAAIVKGKATLRYADRVVLSKPHGSMDWYQHGADPVRCPMSLKRPRLIITPGRNKFRTGYDRPFDSHRERANRDIDHARRFLVLGYGFNDDHLETHLLARVRDGTPTLVLTRTLSAKGEAILTDSPAMTVVQANKSNPNRAVIRTRNSSDEYAGAPIWDLEYFVQEVLEP